MGSPKPRDLINIGIIIGMVLNFLFQEWFWSWLSQVVLDSIAISIWLVKTNTEQVITK